jgi:hypothetical protein
LRYSDNRTCQDSNPAPPRAFQVSTSTEARSSDCVETLVRRTNLSPAAHRPSRSQLDVAPELLRPRTSISSQLSPGVRAAHEATSSVKANDEACHGAVQRARS